MAKATKPKTSSASTIRVVLSGGQLGGQEIDWPEGQAELKLESDVGVCVYSIERHPGLEQADFVGMFEDQAGGV